MRKKTTQDPWNEICHKTRDSIPQSLFAMWIPFLISLGLPVLQSEGPVGGWTAPIWKSCLTTPSVGAPPLDLTGDGVLDVILVANHNPHAIQVLDGNSGEVWFQWPPSPTVHVHATLGFGDVDGDGIEDIVIGQWDFFGDFNLEGRVVVFQGGSGALLWEVWGGGEDQFFGNDVQVVDLNGDGIAEVVDRNPVFLVVLDGATGALKWRRDASLWAHFPRISFPDLDGDLDKEILIQFNQGQSGDHVWALLDSADGHTIWKHHHPFQTTEPTPPLFDANGDGFLDLLYPSFLAQGAIQALDGRTGSLLWLRYGNWPTQEFGVKILVADFDGDGMEDVLCRSQESAAGAKNGMIELLSGLTGLTTWSASGGPTEDLASSLEMLDVDHDGLQDLVAGSHTQIQAFHGATGQVLWSYLPADQYESPRVLRVADLDGDTTPEVVFLDSSYSDQQAAVGLIGVLESQSGQLRWRRTGQSHNEGLGGSIGLRDLDMDGDQDILSSSQTENRSLRLLRLAPDNGTSLWEWTSQIPAWKGRWDYAHFDSLPGPDILLKDDDGQFVAIGGEQAEFLWNLQFETTSIQTPSFSSMSDVNGDGIPEFTLSEDLGYASGIVVHLFSGATGGYHSGLSASPEEVSASRGGRVRLEVDLPDDRATQNYRLLGSLAGTGPSGIAGLDIPLSSDLWFRATLQGIYPANMFRHQEGKLDANGDSTLWFRPTSSRIPATMIGNSIYFAVIAGLGTQAWDISTGFQPILITP